MQYGLFKQELATLTVSFYLLVTATLWTAVAADAPPDAAQPLNYNGYQYAVSDASGDQGHSTIRETDGKTHGSYFFQTPDAHSTIKYVADNFGYHPIVRFGTKPNGPYNGPMLSHFMFGEGDAATDQHFYQIQPKQEATPSPLPPTFVNNNYHHSQQQQQQQQVIQQNGDSNQERHQHHPNHLLIQHQHNIVHDNNNHNKIIINNRPTTVLPTPGLPLTSPTFATPTTPGAHDLASGSHTFHNQLEIIALNDIAERPDDQEILPAFGSGEQRPPHQLFHENINSDVSETGEVASRGQQKAHHEALNRQNEQQTDKKLNGLTELDSLPHRNRGEQKFRSFVEKKSLEGQTAINDGVAHHQPQLQPPQHYLPQINVQIINGNTEADDQTKLSIGNLEKNHNSITESPPPLVSSEFLAPITAGLRLSNDAHTNVAEPIGSGDVQVTAGGGSIIGNTKTIVEIQKSINLRNYDFHTGSGQQTEVNIGDDTTSGATTTGHPLTTGTAAVATTTAPVTTVEEQQQQQLEQIEQNNNIQQTGAANTGFGVDSYDNGGGGGGGDGGSFHLSQHQNALVNEQVLYQQQQYEQQQQQQQQLPFVGNPTQMGFFLLPPQNFHLLTSRHPHFVHAQNHQQTLQQHPNIIIAAPPSQAAAAISQSPSFQFIQPKIGLVHHSSQQLLQHQQHQHQQQHQQQQQQHNENFPLLIENLFLGSPSPPPPSPPLSTSSTPPSNATPTLTQQHFRSPFGLADANTVNRLNALLPQPYDVPIKFQRIETATPTKTLQPEHLTSASGHLQTHSAGTIHLQQPAQQIHNQQQQQQQHFEQQQQQQQQQQQYHQHQLPPLAQSSSVPIQFANGGFQFVLPQVADVAAAATAAAAANGATLPVTNSWTNGGGGWLQQPPQIAAGNLVNTHLLQQQHHHQFRVPSALLSVPALQSSQLLSQHTAANGGGDSSGSGSGSASASGIGYGQLHHYAAETGAAPSSVKDTQAQSTILQPLTAAGGVGGRHYYRSLNGLSLGGGVDQFANQPWYTNGNTNGLQFQVQRPTPETVHLPTAAASHNYLKPDGGARYLTAKEEQEYWTSDQLNVKKGRNLNQFANVRLEYGFKPPFVPSLPIDEHGMPLLGKISTS